MSINSTAINETNWSPLPINSLEKYRYTEDCICEFLFLCGSGYPGSSLNYSSPTGKLFVTDYRLVFIPVPQLHLFQSFSCPFNRVSDVKIDRAGWLSSMFSSFRSHNSSQPTRVSAKIIPQFEPGQRIGKESRLSITFPTRSSAYAFEQAMRPLLFEGPSQVADSFEPLPRYVPRDEPSEAALPSYEQHYSHDSELDKIIALVEQDLSEPYSLYTYRYFIHDCPDMCIMCKLREEPDRIVGVVVGKIFEHRGKRRGYVAMLAVDAAFRNRGIATRLSELLIDDMKGRHVEEIVLETEDTNTASLALYKRLGFVRDKYLPRYYLSGSSAFRLKLWLK